MLDEFILECRRYINNNRNLSEDDIIMHIYLELASKLKFNPEFFFGGSKRRREIYNMASFKEEFNKCFEDGMIICKSAAYMLQYVLDKLNINSVIREEGSRTSRYNHVLNVIIPSDSSESYVVDLQNDMINIHFHGFTSNFGKSISNDQKYVISPSRQKEMHYKLGYLNDDNPTYFDQYIESLRLFIPNDMEFYEKLDIVLSNIEPEYYPNVSYWERRWMHDAILAQLFNARDFAKRVKLVEFYKNVDGETTYNNGFFINTRDGIKIYYYNKENYQYDLYNIPDFASKVIDEDIRYYQGITGLQKEISKQKVKKIQL